MGFLDGLLSKLGPMGGAMGGGMPPTPIMADAEGIAGGAPVPQQGGGLLGGAPQPQGGGLLHGLGNFLKNPEALNYIGATLKDIDSGGSENMTAARNQVLSREKESKALQLKKDDATKRNNAFKAAYVGGKFDPAAYVAALGDEPADLGDLASLTKTLRPEYQYIDRPNGVVQVNKDNGEANTIFNDPKAAPEPTVDHVLGGILSKVAQGAHLSPQETQLYHRWSNGTPSKAHGPAASATGLPPGYVPR